MQGINIASSKCTGAPTLGRLLKRCRHVLPNGGRECGHSQNKVNAMAQTAKLPMMAFVC